MTHNFTSLIKCAADCNSDTMITGIYKRKETAPTHLDSYQTMTAVKEVCGHTAPLPSIITQLKDILHLDAHGKQLLWKSTQHDSSIILYI